MFAAIVLATALATTACGKKKVETPAPAPAAAAAPAGRPPRPRRRRPPRRHRRPQPAAPTEDELFARKTLDQLNAERALADVFFDLDSAEIDPRRADHRSRRTPTG